MRFDACLNVGFTGYFAAIGVFGWESGMADWAFVFFANLGPSLSY